MQIQPISNNYQARSQRTQKAQKQNNPSFGASIIFKSPAEIKILEESLEKMAAVSSKKTTRNFLIRTRNFLVETLRSIATHNRKPESHVLYDATCTVPVNGISFSHTTGGIVFDSVNSSVATEVVGYVAEHPEDTSMVIQTVSGATVKVPITTSSEELAKIGERVQNAAISMREQLNPTNSTREYLEIIQKGTESQPIQNSNLYND